VANRANNPKLELRRGKLWGVRYYDAKGACKWKTLGRVDRYPDESSVSAVYHEFLAALNAPSAEVMPAVDPNDLVALFVEHVYFPEAEKHLRGNTFRGYKGIWSALQSHTQIGQIRTRMVRTPHVQAALDALAAAKHPSRASLARVKSFLTQVFSEAVRRGFRDTDHNPVRDTKLPHGKAAEETYAYSLAETRQVLNLLPPCASTICAVGAFAGLRRGEIFGLQWRDFDEKAGVLNIRREVAFDKRGRMIVTEPKTESSKAAVPVIAPLAAALTAWRAAQSAVAEGSWMFPASFVRAEHPEGVVDVLGQTPINPGNFDRDQVKPMLSKAGVVWRGFHSFRRGLATNLHALEVQDIDIQQILRHSSVDVTRECYIKAVSATAKTNLDKIDVAWSKLPSTMLN
jgi:integrase